MFVHLFTFGMFAWFMLTDLSRADAPADFQLTPQYQSVLNAHHIRITGEGQLDVSYEAARVLFEQDDILDAVQVAYAQLLEDGEAPEFVVEQRGHRHWGYVNKSGHQSEIIELHRQLEPDQAAELVLYSEGERFFGRFRAVIKVHVAPVSAEAIRYDVLVYAYPENAVSRFFARRLGIAERFFRHKTAEITGLATRICRHLLG